jgi:hypothetical protein
MKENPENVNFPLFFGSHACSKIILEIASAVFISEWQNLQLQVLERDLHGCWKCNKLQQPLVLLNGLGHLRDSRRQVAPPLDASRTVNKAFLMR